MFQQPALRIKRNQRLAFLVILGETPLQSFRSVVAAPGEPSRALGTIRLRGINIATNADIATARFANKPATHALANGVVIDIKRNGHVEWRVSITQHLLQRPRLADRARESVEYKIAVVLLKPAADQLDDHLVWNEAAVIGKFRGFSSKPGARGFFLAKNRPHRRSRDAKGFPKHFRLRAFARCRRSQQHDPPFH